MEFAAAAASAGFDAVECSAALLPTRAEDALAIFRGLGIDVVGVCPSDELLDWHHFWDASTQVRLAHELDRAASLGAAYFVLPFMRPNGDRRSVEYGLEQAVPLARARGLKLAVEPIGHFDVLRRAEELAPVLRTQDASVVSLLLDSFHFFRAGHGVDDLELYDDLPVAGIQLSNINHRADHDAVGYRDRAFPLDGRWPVLDFATAAMKRFPSAPLIAEVIGDVASATPTDLGAARAHAHLTRIVEQCSQEAFRG